MTVHTFLQQLLFSKKGFHLHLMSLNISSRFSRNSEVFASTLLPIFCFTKVKSETNTRLLWIELYSEASASEDRLSSVSYLSPVLVTFTSICSLSAIRLCWRNSSRPTFSNADNLFCWSASQMCSRKKTMWNKERNRQIWILQLLEYFLYTWVFLVYINCCMAVSSCNIEV